MTEYRPLQPPRGPYDRRQQYSPPQLGALPSQGAPMGGGLSPYPFPGAPEPPKRRRVWPWIVLAVVSIMLVAVAVLAG